MLLLPRPRRADEANGIYHALNRGNVRNAIFQKDADFDAFERILAEGLKLYPCRILSYQLMPNHWHFVLKPTEGGGMSNFLRWVTLTHTQRYHSHYGTSGQGQEQTDCLAKEKWLFRKADLLLNYRIL